MEQTGNGQSLTEAPRTNVVAEDQTDVNDGEQNPAPENPDGNEHECPDGKCPENGRGEEGKKTPRRRRRKAPENITDKSGKRRKLPSPTPDGNNNKVMPLPSPEEDGETQN